MITHAAPSRPVCSAVSGFLGVTLIALALGLANKVGIIDADVAKRGIGLAIGLMTVVIGNYLPKLRALAWARANAGSTATERMSGWMLVMTGIAWIALFSFVPLSQARHVSAMIGISALTIIFVNWAWQARGGLFLIRKEQEGSTISSVQTTGNHRIVGYLLFAFFYAFVTACVKFLIENKQLADELTSWMLVAFGMLYAALFAVLEYRHASK
jgi:hypothetical protein